MSATAVPGDADRLFIVEQRIGPSSTTGRIHGLAAAVWRRKAGSSGDKYPQTSVIWASGDRTLSNGVSAEASTTG